MKLTKQQAIEEHRKMWNWIAENGYKLYAKNLGDIKTYYIHYFFSNKLECGELISAPFFNCFCCEYAVQETDIEFLFSRKKCVKCPLYFHGGYCDSDSSPFYRLSRRMTYGQTISEKEFKSLALEIANLPEREEGSIGL